MTQIYLYKDDIYTEPNKHRILDINCNNILYECYTHDYCTNDYCTRHDYCTNYQFGLYNILSSMYTPIILDYDTSKIICNDCSIIINDCRYGLYLYNIETKNNNVLQIMLVLIYICLTNKKINYSNQLLFFLRKDHTTISNLYFTYQIIKYMLIHLKIINHSI